jgi:hypothetical protein
MPEPVERLPAPSGPGSVVLDIGGDVGAAMVRAGATLAAEELEIRRRGSQWEGRHVAVRERWLPRGPVWAAVFDNLEEGWWEVRLKGKEEGASLVFEVAGGRVTVADWPD